MVVSVIAPGLVSGGDQGFARAARGNRRNVGVRIRHAAHPLRGRIRLNVSSRLTQFAAAHDFCERTRWPICSGLGLTNPISYPISRSDPLGIITAITGVAPPPNPRYPR